LQLRIVKLSRDLPFSLANRLLVGYGDRKLQLRTRIRNLAVKKIAVLPALLTLGNGVCGLAAIAFASKIYPEYPTVTDEIVRFRGSTDEANFALAGWLILFAMVFDMLDGYVARLTKTASDFGGELDSLCDVVSFGIAPAFLLLKLGPGWANPFLHQVLAGIAAIYFACTALRLARFNVQNDPDPASHKRFRGLPSPGAAGCIAALAVLRGDLSSMPAMRMFRFDVEQTQQIQSVIAHIVEIASPIGALVIALLMVSNVPYPHLTGKIFRGKRHIGHLIQVLLAAFILLMFRSLAPLLIFWVYAFLFPLRWLLMRNLRTEPEPDSPGVDEQAPRQL
jgi:CDP-diacylglycerol--serine O-phosphatidyltransferase